MAQLFPRGIAVGKAFYDRTEERKHLRKNIEHTIHTVLIAPRRFGKTSLMAQVLHENNYPSIWLDFMTVTDMNEVQQKLAHKISDLIVQITPIESKIKKIVSKYFRKLKPEIILSIPGVSIRFHPDLNPQQSITELLIELDKLAGEMKKRIVIIMDEFQEISRIEPENNVLQASIRHAAERSSSITYLFSGSKHRPLKKIFRDKNNPLYELCEVMTIERIKSEHYKEFINRAALKKWGYPLNESLLERILDHTDRYPKYVNALCGYLWSNDLAPTLELVDELWKSYLLGRKTDITDELSQLTLNQRRLLQSLAFEPWAEVFSKDFLTKINLSQSSVQAALEILLNKGLIAEIEGKYRVLDPTIRAYFHIF
jgi:uncharacterized protein